MFSVVIPVYGTERYLPRCLESVLKQTCRDFEVVVVDDCSPGNCAEVVSRFAGVRYVRNDRNRGCFASRVVGARAARGEYVVPVDPDDYILPNLLGRVQEVVDREAPDFISYLLEYDRNGKIEPHWCRHVPGTLSAEAFMQMLAEGRGTWGIVSKVVRRSTYLSAMEAYGRPEDLYVNTSEDFATTLPVLLTADKVALLDCVGYRYFTNDESITAGRRTIESLKRACAETRLVHDRVGELAARLPVGEGKRELLTRIISQCERYFVAETLEGPGSEIEERVNVLLEVFHPENLAREMAQWCAKTKLSRSYRMGTALAKLFRRLRGR